MKSQLRQHLKPTIFTFLRTLRYRQILGKLGKKVFIEKNVEFLRFPKNIFINDEVVIKDGAKLCACNKTAKIFIGQRSTVGYHTFIFATSRIDIGNDCLIAPFVYLVDSNHQFKKGIPINQQPNESAPIKIGNDVWIASNVTILKGVKIGSGAIIAANSVVNCNVPENMIFGGSPAKKIGDRI